MSIIPTDTIVLSGQKSEGDVHCKVTCNGTNSIFARLVSVKRNSDGTYIKICISAINSLHLWCY